MADASIKATMLQLEPQLKQFCEKADFLKMLISAKGTYTEDHADALRKLNISVGVALNDMKTAEGKLMKGGGTRKRRSKTRKTCRR
jgi:hypothetical protein